MPAKRHHLLPQLYLRRWADADGQVRLVDAREGRSFIANVADAVVQNHFYSVETDDGSPPDIVEKALAELEGYAAKGFAALDDGMWPLDVESRTALAHFIALQIPRGEVFRATMNRTADQIGKMVLQMAAAHPATLRRLMRETGDGTEPTDEEVAAQAEFLARGEYTIRESQNASVALFLETAGELVEPVFACSWDLVTVTGEGRMITADEPIRMWRAPGKAPAWMGVGIFTAEDITLPLDPMHCLRFSMRMGAPDRVFKIGDQEVEIINGRTAQGAHRYLVVEKTWQPSSAALPPDE